ncbi:MFS transporter [Bordetella sp. N]|uniref:MFS transporter n=1 Tax=Bordetella sp. N TaxID=1746199 RepID=UPI00071107D2|nr:MFS transporter [Bordetella sp. N]ALM86785.1 MFS transporter [Bordetella sp. N]
MASTPDPDNADAPLVTRPAFAHFLLSRFGASLAYQMVSVAVGWQIYSLTGSAMDLGLIGLAQFMPMLLLTLVVGHVADRYDRRKILAVTLTIETLSAAVLSVVSLAGEANHYIVYACIIAMSASRAFESPTMPTLIPAVVPRALIPRATAVSASSNQIAQIAGPALGGVGYALGAGWIYALTAVCYFIALVSMLTLKIEGQPSRKEPTTWRSLFAGFTFIASRRILLGTLTLDLFAVLLGGATALLPIYAKDILHAGPWALGMLRAAPALGAVSMALVLGRKNLTGNIGMTLFGALFAFGIATVVFGISTSIPVSIVALMVLGAADSISVVVRSSLVQLNTPNDMLGRVSAINMLFIGTSNQMGEFRAGVMASMTGAVAAVVLGGVGTIAVAALWMYWYPELRRLRSLHNVTPETH